MAIPCNPAMAPEEMAALRSLPPGPAWMSCHFSGRELRDLPRRLPAGSLLILDDSIPPQAPDPDRILSQLLPLVDTFSCQGLLLDFEAPETPGLPELATALDRGLPCPVAVPEACGAETRGPVFLSLLPPHVSLEAAAAPWQGRELWMELGPGAEVIRLQESGAEISPLSGSLPDCPFQDSALCCRYRMDCSSDRADFTLVRGPEELRGLLQQGEKLGVRRALGLWQEVRFLFGA